jgi:hypothetical protein
VAPEANLGWPCRCTPGAVHGHAGGNAPQPNDPRLRRELKAKGKLPKVVIAACMRKLLTIMNTIAQDRSAWHAVHPAKT